MLPRCSFGFFTTSRSHWFPFIGSFISYRNAPLNFFIWREKYSDVFTFTPLGREVTVALGAKGNNFVLGGKSTTSSAEDVYTIFLNYKSHIMTAVYDVPNEVFKKFVEVGLSTENFRAYASMFEQGVHDFMRSD
ncbi:hypothetical protein BDR07DRAFT_1276807 [Suillus spraguei]|nr:hypothetical protein BDR07DRAFT_1276807 [Suillus spraguei]